MYKLIKEASNPKAIVQIIHGAAEHIQRYENFASFLTKQGYSVYGINNSGHGDDINNNSHHIKNQSEVLNELKEENIKYQKFNLPIYVIGHSMGSILLRNLILDKEFKADKVILIGITNPSKLKLYPGKIFINALMIFQKKTDTSKLVDTLLFKEFEKQMLKKYRTKNWISSDLVEYQKYLDDKKCGNPFTNQAAKVLLQLTINSVKKENIEQLKKKDYLILAGAKDPVSNFTKEIKVLDKNLAQPIRIKIYEKMYHEILNEMNKTNVYADIIDFLDN